MQRTQIERVQLLVGVLEDTRVIMTLIFFHDIIVQFQLSFQE